MEKSSGGFFRALGSRNYRLFFAGQSLSLMGTWVTQVATTWLVYRLTHSAMWLGLVGFSSQFLTFLLAPVAGVLADRWNRRRILIATQVLGMLQSFALAALALSGKITAPQVLVLSMAQGLINAFDVPARQSLVVDLVEKREDMSNAIALNSLMFNSARLVGPPLAGVLIAAAGEGICFLIDGFSYFAVILALIALRVQRRQRQSGSKHVFLELKEGIAYAFKTRPIRALLLYVAFISFSGMPYAVLLPIYAKDIFQGGANAFGLLLGASGVGALIGSAYLASRKSTDGLAAVIVANTMLFGAAILAFSVSRLFWLSEILMVLVGFGMIAQMASGNTLLQALVDDDKRGRVMSLFAMAFMGTMPFGSLLAGHAADVFGAPATLFVSGLMCLAVGAVCARPLMRYHPRRKHAFSVPTQAVKKTELPINPLD